MPRTKYGQPGIYNATPITLPDGAGSALAVNANGQLIAAAPSGSSANEVKQTDGTNIVNTLKSDGTAAGQNAELVAGTYLSVPFTTTTVQAVGTTDVGNYRWVSVQIVTQGTSSSVAFQASNDNSTWTNIILINASTATSSGQSSATAVATYHGMLTARYFRLNVTGISAGTTAGTILFSTLAGSSIVVNTMTAQSGTWTVGTSSSYPATATAVTNSSGNVANASAAATLAGTSGKTTYITGFEVTSSGATIGSVVNVTVTGTISGTLTYTYAAPAGVLAMGTPLIIEFPIPIPASATNTAIVVTLPALGAGNTNATTVAHGYQL